MLLSAVSVAVVQGGLTLLGVTLGAVVPEAHRGADGDRVACSSSASPSGSLNVRHIPVGDLLPSLLVAPLLVSIVAQFR